MTFPSITAERDHWKDRALRAEAALLAARRRRAFWSLLSARITKKAREQVF